MKKLLTFPLIAGLALPAAAMKPMPEPGFNGAVNLGASVGEIESNFLAEIDTIDVDLGKSRLDSSNLDGPDSEDLTMAVANLDLGYTLANGKTRFSVGNDFSDFIEFERTTRISARHDFDNIGNMRVDLLQAPAFTTEVYADPYQLNQSRDTTDMEVSGVRFIWDRVFQTGLELTVTGKNIDIDEERSGQAFGLDSDDRRLLDREGDTLLVEVAYHFDLNDSNSLRPSVFYSDRDLDGDAMAQDGYGISLLHKYRSDGLLWSNFISYADMDGDKENPIFNEVNDAETYAVATTLAFPGAIKFLGKWVPNVAATWADRDSDIDFNDSSIWMVSVALQRNF